MLDNLGASLKDAVKKLAGKTVIDREHVLRIVYQELVRMMGTPGEVTLGPQTILMAGLQGSGKTTTTAKLARYFQRKGLRVGVICADTFRPGAYDQLKTLCDRIGVACFGDPNESDAIKIVREGPRGGTPLRRT
ncbi:MAG: Signal recognition particle 54 kDa protein [Methanoculleus marisnigri]|uniref:Signal recognition particle 54 kDa protein n=1 Tax=Methanoculleus marisnigri TaxID=2198 RepID=A0A101J1Z5_9EURY|nr:MAG: Signal recognition particle 54 kDa protein [Methanoculleus marisnigri]